MSGIEQRIADVLPQHQFHMQTTGESGITVQCTCGHQSTAPGTRQAYRNHDAHVAAVLVAELGLTQQERTSSWDMQNPHIPKNVATRYITPWETQ